MVLQGERERVEEDTEAESLPDPGLAQSLPQHLPHGPRGQSGLAGSVGNKSESENISNLYFYKFIFTSPSDF